MVNTGADANNIFRLVEHIMIEDIKNQAHGYFGLQGIGNVNQILSNPLIVSDITQLAGGNKTKIQNFRDMVRSIEESITKTSLKKLRLHHREYEWTDDGGLIRNDRTTMIYLTFQSINPATRIGVSNLNYEIDKSTLAKF